jgi:hypothetical protein
LIERNKAAQQKLVHVLKVVTVKAHEEIEMVNVGEIDKALCEINVDRLWKYLKRAIRSINENRCESDFSPCSSMLTPTSFGQSFMLFNRHL